jgi:flagellar biosynthesis protein FlhF
MEQLKKYKNFLSKDNLDNYVQTCLGSLVLTKTLDLNVKKQNKVIALVGPTGVGKTTTIAKLALIAKIIHKLDVGLISIDTYRLGAVDQLKSFADVSHTDFLVAYEPSENAGINEKICKERYCFYRYRWKKS